MLLPSDLRPADFARFRLRQLTWLVLACIAGTAFAATGPPSYRADAAPIEARLTIAGSRTTHAVLAGWIAIFRREHPAVRVVIEPLGSGVVAGAMADGAADAAPLARALRPDERSMATAARRALHGVLVGYLEPSHRPVFIYVNRSMGGQPSRAAAELVRVALSPEGQAQMRAAGFRPLDDTFDGDEGLSE